MIPVIRRWRAVSALALTLALGVSTGSYAGSTQSVDILPTIFVHGGAGSAAQYVSQQMRFTSNGVPQERILAFEYSSTDPAAVAAAPLGLDAMVDQVRARFGVERVNLVGHSLGTSVSGAYLANPARAAKIAKYIGIDGRSDPTCGSQAPGTLTCMGIFRGSVGNVGGNNVYFNGMQTHVEAATSRESFAAQFQFLTGQAPATTKIWREKTEVQIAGRTVNFPQNSGADGATLEIWKIETKTGKRQALDYVLSIGADGRWGPVQLDANTHYEFNVIRAGMSDVHFYHQPFIRDTDMVRLNVSPAGSLILTNTNTSDNHSGLVISRQKEWWVNHPSGQNDVLTIETSSASLGGQPAVDVIPAITTTGAFGVNGIIALHVHDDAATPGVTTLAPLPYFPTVTFQTGMDVYMPAATPTDGTIRLRSLHRGDASNPQVLYIPNWASSGHRISVIFNDYVQ